MLKNTSFFKYVLSADQETRDKFNQAFQLYQHGEIEKSQEIVTALKADYHKSKI